MRFNRSELIARTKETMVNRVAAAREAFDAKVADYEAERRAYVAETGEAWHQFVLNIQRARRSNTPVTWDDVPDALKRSGSFGSRINTFDRPKPQPVPASTADLHRLLAFLEASPDETITTAGLRELGFNLRQLFS